MGRREAIKARAEKATPGPWRADKASQVGERETVEFPVVLGLFDSPAGGECAEILFEGDLGRDADAEFIAHAREDIPWLVAELERAEGALRLLPKPLHNGNFQMVNDAVLEVCQAALAALSGEGR